MRVEQAVFIVGETSLDLGFTTPPTPHKLAELALSLMSELGLLEQVDMTRLLESARHVAAAIEVVLAWRQCAGDARSNPLTEALW